MVELDDVLDVLRDRTKSKFAKMPEVVVKDGSFDADDLPIGAKWHRLTDLVVVSFDLKSSTNLEKGRKPASTASIYDAGVGGAVHVLEEFDCDFVDIQGDGGFGLFWDDKRYERAMCAAITIRTFSEDFTSQLEAKWPDAPTTGFKVGVANGPVLAKRVGLPRHLNFQEPVWAGRPVNYAAKTAQQGDPDRLLVTGGVWDEIANNDYIAFSCDCNGDPKLLWHSVELDKIPDANRYGQSLGSTWCKVHGQEFCAAILAGKTRRDDVGEGALHGRNQLDSGTAALVEARKSRTAERELLKADARASRY